MKKSIVIIVSIFTVFVLADTIWWLHCTLTLEGHAVIVSEYLSVFPEFISNGRAIAWLRLLLCIFSFIASIYFISKKYILPLSIVILFINGLLFCWTGFSLM